MSGPGKYRDASDMERAKLTAQRMAKTGRNKCTKVLCPTEATGSLIGAQGASMKKLEKDNTASIRVSKRGETFPGFDERVIDIMGNLAALKVCVNSVQVHIRSTVDKFQIPTRSRNTYCIIILSDDAAGKMLGNGGQGTQKLTSKWKVQIEASVRKDMSSTLMERWVKVCGVPSQVEGCINEIITMSVEPGIKPMTHGVCYADITGYTDKFAVPSASASRPVAAVPSASKLPSASKPAETPNKFAPLSKSSDNPNHHGFNTSARNAPSGLTASVQNKMNPYKPESYDTKAKAKVAKKPETDDDGWQTVTKSRKNSTGEAASPDTSPTARLGELEITEGEYFDLTGYSVYHIVNLGLDNLMPVKMVLKKDF